MTVQVFSFLRKGKTIVREQYKNNRGKTMQGSGETFPISSDLQIFKKRSIKQFNNYLNESLGFQFLKERKDSYQRTIKNNRGKTMQGGGNTFPRALLCSYFDDIQEYEFLKKLIVLDVCEFY